MNEQQKYPILVKRYGQERLYDTAGLRYLSLPELRQWMKDGVAFVIRDAKTGEDLTRKWVS